MSRIPAIFQAGRPLVIPFITGGYPSLEVTELAIPALEQALGGPSIIEIGFPFTDPIADGPVIAQSMHQALLNGVTPRMLFDVVSRVRPRTNAGLLAMVTDSIITRYRGGGPEQFVREAAAAGFDGLIVPDIDLDAAVPLAGLARLHDLTFTLLVAPTTTDDRLKRILELCSGFVYVLARVGITGESADIDVPALQARLAQIRRHTVLPLAIGFGISRPDQVRTIARLANAAIVGSALVRRMGEAGEHDAVEAARTFVSDLVRGLREAMADAPQ